MFNYNAFKLHIQSELAFLELMPCIDDLACTPDVIIEFGEVSKAGLSKVVTEGAFYQAAKGEFWLNVPDIARYYVRDGNTIIVDPHAGCDEDSIRLFLLGSCLGALLMQRGLFLLHGNAIKVGEHCIAFLGQSGVGKSTVAGAFMARGYSILADDICAVNQAGDVVPSFPQIKLWADSSEKLAINTEGLRRIRPGFNKFSMSLKQKFHEHPLPLKILYLLNSHHQDNFEFEDIHGMKKILPLKKNTYRYPYLKGLDKTKHHLKQAGALASQVSIVRINRPKEGFRLEELLERIEADLCARVGHCV